MITAELQSTIVFQKNWEEYQKKEKRIVLNIGGTGSSKTISLAQLFAMIMIKEKNVQITIARKTFPALRATAMKDFFDILKDMGAYQEGWHNKSENTYYYAPSGSLVDFISVDEPIKIRSRRRNYLWMNEGNEFTKDDYMQLSMRTDKQIFMDFNPSHLYHFIYDEIESREDCIVINSTFKDNPFLPRELVKEIEGYKSKDKNYWRIYGLGLKGFTETLIYTHWQYCKALPEHPDKIFYGLDFGFNNQTALVKIAEKDRNYFWKELLYERYLTTSDLIRSEKVSKETDKELGRFHQFVKDGILTYQDTIYADNSEPDRIKEIEDAGFNILPCTKLHVKDGIDRLKSKSFYITKDSLNLQREVKIYSWKERDGKPLEEPVKQNDHLLDAGRYAIITEEGEAVPPFPEPEKPMAKVEPGQESEMGRPDSAGMLEREF